MSMLSSAQLTKMRADVARMLPDTCLIERPTNSVDSYGNPSQTYTTVSSAEACRLDPFNLKDAGEEFAKMLMRETATTVYRLTLAHDADIQYGDRVTLDSVIYEIHQISAAHSWQVSTRAVISSIQEDVA